MTLNMTGRPGRLVGTAVLASAAWLVFGLFASPAQAAAEPALYASISEPAPVAPGGRGEVEYKVTNVSNRATEGTLLNISLPPNVSLESDARCRRVGFNDNGGELISCSLSDELGKFAPGETKVARNTPFFIDASAPKSTELGHLEALVVPLENGYPTESPNDLDGYNYVSTPITTSG